MSQAFRHLDRRGVGKICVADALRAVRGEVSKRRAQVIDEVFDSLLFRLGGDSDAGDGQHSHTLEPVTVAKLYRAEAHPDVVSGVRTQAEVLSEFLEAFEGKQVSHHLLSGHHVSQWVRIIPGASTLRGLGTLTMSIFFLCAAICCILRQIRVTCTSKYTLQAWCLLVLPPGSSTLKIVVLLRYLRTNSHWVYK